MPTRRNGERGVALLLTMFALIIVTAIGFSMMFQTDTETLINSNFRDQQAGYYAAAAGLEEARDRMDSTAAATVSGSLPTAPPGNADGVLYITNPSGGESIEPWNSANEYFDNEICQEVNCSGSLVPPTSGWYKTPVLAADNSYAADPVLPYKWARISLKKNRSAAGTVNTMYVNDSDSPEDYVCWDGTHEYTSSTPCVSPALPVYTLTALAVTPNGTRRMLQYELTRDSLDISAPGALTLVGPSATTNFPTSANYVVSGNDQPGCGSTTTTSSVPAVGVGSSAVDDSVTDAIPHGPPGPNREDNYVGSGGNSSDVQAVSMPAEYQSVESLEALLAKIKTKVTQPVLTGNQNGLSNPGTSSSPQIIYVDGDLSLSGSVTGYGVLVVTGTLNLAGSIGWKGIIFVVGEGVVNGSGGGNKQIEGGLVVATTRDSSGNLLSSLGTTTFDWNGGGGGGGIHYTSGCLKQGSQTADYQILSSRELMY